MSSTMDAGKAASIVKRDLGVSGLPLSMNDFKVGTQNERFAEAIASANAAGRPLAINEPLVLSQMFDVTGYIDLRMTDDGELMWVGGTANQRAGLRARNLGGSPTPIATFSPGGIAYEDHPAGGYVVASLTVNDASGIAAQDVIYIKSDRTNEYSEASSGFAEIFHVVAKSGNKLYLSGRFERLTTGHGGSVFVMPRRLCSIQGKFSTDQATNRQYCVWAEGYVHPRFDLDIPVAASSGLNIVSAYGGGGIVRGANMRRDLVTDSNNPRLGYNVALYGAAKGVKVRVDAQNVYHAFTTSMGTSSDLWSGHPSGNSVTGVATGCTGHAFDTHMDDEGTTFENIVVLDGHTDSYQSEAGTVAAVQLRGHNAVVRGLYTNLDRAIIIKEWAQFNTRTRISDVEHVDRLNGGPSSTNGLYTVSFQELVSDGNNNTQDSLGNAITRNGVKKTVLSNIKGYYVDYQYAYTGDEWYACRLDWSRTTRGWPGYVAGGGDHLYFGCKIIDPVNLNIGGNGTNTGHKDKVRLHGGYVESSSGTNNFTLADGAYLESLNHAIKLSAGGNVNTASYARTTISSGQVDFIYLNPAVIDGRAQGSKKAFDNQATGGTVNVTNLALGGIARTRTADTATTAQTRKLSQCSYLLDLTGSIAGATNYTIDETGAPAGTEFVIRCTGGGAGSWAVKNAAGTTLVTLGNGKQATLHYDGASLRLMASGATPSTTP